MVHRLRVNEVLHRLRPGLWRLAPLLALTLAWIALLYLATGGGPPGEWLQGWARWDAHFYLRIWTEGYGSDPVSLAFPPGYPWLVGSLSWITGWPFFTVGSLVSLLSLLTSGMLLARLAERDFGVSGTLAYSFWLCAPALYFALSPYSDLLFCALLLATLYGLTAPRLSRSEQAALLLVIALLPLVRITAFALFILLLLRRWQVLAMLPGAGLFLWLNHSVTGDALHFVRVQSQFLMPDGHLLDGLRGASSGLFSAPSVEDSNPFLNWLQLKAVPMGQLAALLGTAGWLAWRRHGVLALSLLAILLMSHNQGFWRSVVRYDLVLWMWVSLPLLRAIQGAWHRSTSVSTPVIVNASVSARTPPAGLVVGLLVLGAWMMLSLLLQLRFAGVFHRGGWGF